MLTNVKNIIKKTALIAALLASTACTQVLPYGNDVDHSYGQVGGAVSAVPTDAITILN